VRAVAGSAPAGHRVDVDGGWRSAWPRSRQGCGDRQSPAARCSAIRQPPLFVRSASGYPRDRRISDASARVTFAVPPTVSQTPVAHELALFHHDRLVLLHPRPRGRDFTGPVYQWVRAHGPSCWCSSRCSLAVARPPVQWTRWLRRASISLPKSSPSGRAEVSRLVLSTMLALQERRVALSSRHLGDDSMPEAPAHGDHRRENGRRDGIDRDVEDERWRRSSARRAENGEVAQARVSVPKSSMPLKRPGAGSSP